MKLSKNLKEEIFLTHQGTQFSKNCKTNRPILITQIKINYSIDIYSQLIYLEVWYSPRLMPILDPKCFSISRL